MCVLLLLWLIWFTVSKKQCFYIETSFPKSCVSVKMLVRSVVPSSVRVNKSKIQERVQCLCSTPNAAPISTAELHHRAHCPGRAASGGLRGPRQSSSVEHWLIRSPDSTAGWIFSHQSYWGWPGSCRTGDHLESKDNTSQPFWITNNLQIISNTTYIKALKTGKTIVY